QEREAIPRLAGIDVENTVHRLGIPFASLRPMYLRFLDGQRPIVEQLEAAAKSGNGAEVLRQAHALSGASGNLRPHAVRKAAGAIESAAREGRTDVSELLGNVQREAKIVFGSIEALRAPAAAIEATGADALTSADRAELAPLLEGLRKALADSDHSGC